MLAVTPFAVSKYSKKKKGNLGRKEVLGLKFESEVYNDEKSTALGT